MECAPLPCVAAPVLMCGLGLCSRRTVCVAVTECARLPVLVCYTGVCSSREWGVGGGVACISCFCCCASGLRAAWCAELLAAAVLSAVVSCRGAHALPLLQAACMRHCCIDRPGLERASADRPVKPWMCAQLWALVLLWAGSLPLRVTSTGVGSCSVFRGIHHQLQQQGNIV